MVCVLNDVKGASAECIHFKLTASVSRILSSIFCRTETIKMDTSNLPKIQDEERESQFGYVHGVSGPGLVYIAPFF